MKIKYGALALSLTALYSCNQLDDIYKDLDKDAVGNVKTLDDYVLTDADYKYVADVVKKDTTITDTSLKEIFLNNYAFNSAVPADKYIPMILAERFYSWEEGSSVGVTYNSLKNLTESFEPYAALQSYMFTSEDYAAVWEFPFFAPSNDLESILLETLETNFPDATANELVLLKYKYSSVEPTISPVFSDDFETDLSKWTIVGNDTKSWEHREFSGNHYAQLSAYGAEGEVVSYMVSEPMKIKGEELLSFKTQFDYISGDALDVLISESFDGTTIDETEWKSVKDEFKYPEEVRVFVESGDLPLEDYKDKTIYVAFKYLGNGDGGVTTTVRIDDVMVGALAGNPTDTLSLYQFDGTTWATDNADNVNVLDDEDYNAMGTPGKYDNFNSVEESQIYISSYLTGEYPYAQIGQSEFVIANIYKEGYRAFEYIFDGAEWVDGTFEVIEKEKYIRLADNWAFDATFTLEVGNTEYQVMLDWVKENEPAYIDPKYDTSEFWFGASTYYGNFNNQIVKRRTNDPDGILTDMSDAEVKVYLTEQTSKGIMLALGTLYDIPATDKNGMDQIVVVSAKVYDGANWKYTYTFTSLGNDEFAWDSKDLVITPW